QPVWRSPFNVTEVAVGPELFGDNGDMLSPAAGATAIGGFSPTEFPGQGAVLIGNGDRTLAIGFMLDEMDPFDGSAFAGNAVQALAATRTNTLVYGPGSDHGYGWRVARRAGLRPVLVGTDDAFIAELEAHDYGVVIFDNPCCGTDLAALDALGDFIADGGRVLFSYWNLDAEPATQADLGIAATIDFFTPAEVYQWSFGHPIFTAPHFIPNPIGLSGDDAWNDNGDQLMAAGGATALGGFTSSPTAGQGAIVVANSNRTIVNGFEYDSMANCDIVHLLENELAFLVPSGLSPIFRRGDCNTDGTFDISDPVFLLSELFTMGTIGQCRDACDTNDDGVTDISDAVFMLSAQFIPGAPPVPAPAPLCGQDPTADGLGCNNYPVCL
ncbi:MAG: hypothetical protein KDC38_13535, partial [Planctomycetes bacterium]|nr:hypothetical protein [Planctomycetota bacterium]